VHPKRLLPEVGASGPARGGGLADPSPARPAAKDETDVVIRRHLRRPTSSCCLVLSPPCVVVRVILSADAVEPAGRAGRKLIKEKNPTQATATTPRAMPMHARAAAAGENRQLRRSGKSKTRREKRRYRGLTDTLSKKRLARAHHAERIRAVPSSGFVRG